MANDFLDKYNKKAEQTTSEIDISSSSQPTKMEYTQNSGFTPPKKTSHAQTKKFPIWYVIIPTALIIIIAIIIFIFTLGTKLPNMTGWTKSEAELWANENNVIIRTESVFSDEVESSKIISQSPQEGEKIKKGEFLELVISSGPDYSILVEVPDLMSMSMAEVEAWASDNLMTKVRITTEASETVEMGKAIKYTINDDTVTAKEVKRDTAVYVVFSSGMPEGEPIEVPDFSIMSREEAETFAEDNNIILVINEEFSDKYMEGQIFEQDIKAEETITAGSVLTLTISKGEEILVPKFADYTKEEALIEASLLGITIVTEEKYSKYSEDTLISQSISAGTLYQDGDYVKLVYSLGNKVELSSFVGQDETSLKAWVTSYNELGASISINTTYTTSTQYAGTILSQNKYNENIGISESISIVVSSGPELYTPNFVQSAGESYGEIITRDIVIEMCDELGIVPIFVAEAKDGRLEGEVWYQSQNAGTEIKQGDTITIKYVPVTSTFVVPDFYGMTKDEIELAGYDKQFTIVYSESEYVNEMDNKAVAQSYKKNSVLAPGTIIEISICPEMYIEPELEDDFEDELI